jgi:kynurenine formamidase
MDDAVGPVGTAGAGPSAARSIGALRVLDLSVDISEAHPAWYVYDPPYRADFHVTYDAPPSHSLPFGGGGYFSRTLTGEEHLGTHYDVPAHVIPGPASGLPNAGPAGELTTDKVALDRLHGPGLVVDCTGYLDNAPNGRSPVIPRSHLEAWEQAHGPIEAGSCVLLRTDYTDRYYRPYPEGRRFMYEPVVAKSAPGWPAPSEDALEWLASKGVGLVGIDGSGIGPVEGDYGVHVAGLKHGMVFVEKLIGLGELPPRGSYFIFLPIKVIGGGAAPGRAIAFVSRV